MVIDLQKLKSVLIEKIEPIEKEKRQAAVIVPIIYENNGFSLLFEKRVDNGSLHGGQVSFPGGSIEPEDKSISYAALRETQEEIGIDKDKITILGALRPTITKSTDFVVYPFVGFIKEDAFHINKDEIQYLFTIPIEYLIKNHPFEEREYKYKGKQYSTFIINYDKNVVWGATARIINELIKKIKQIV